MRTVRFRAAGKTRVGEWTEAGIEAADRVFDPETVTILPPCEPTKIVAIGLNYADHAAERDAAIPDRPKLFFKTPNAVAAHGDTIELPEGIDHVDHEAEFGVVVATQARNVDEADAWEYVQGFTIVNDVSNRDDQQREQNWVRAKAFDGAAPMGPVIADPEDVPEDAAIELRVNGQRRQASDRSQFVFSVPELLAEITTHITLEPGDVISTGTPAGVAPLEPGDHVAIEIEGVGTLEHDVA